MTFVEQCFDFLLLICVHYAYVSHDSSVGELMHLTVCLLCGQGLIPSRGSVFQGVFHWLITHTRKGDGRRQVITSSIERIRGIRSNTASSALRSPDDQKMVVGLKKIMHTVLGFSNIVYESRVYSSYTIHYYSMVQCIECYYDAA